MNKSVGLVMLLGVLCLADSSHAGELDLAIIGGRVIDPETKLDGVLNVGISGEQIAVVTSEPIEARTIIDAEGLVVSPGFIDLHVHGQTNEAHYYQAYDGVTTALELESGRYPIAEFLSQKSGNTLINYGASVNQTAARTLSMNSYQERAAELIALIKEHGEQSATVQLFTLQMLSGANYQELTEAELAATLNLIRDELNNGALGIGVPVGYQPGASQAEMFRLFELAAHHDSIIFSHVRDPGITGIQEMIANSAATKASLHVVHLNSMALGEIRLGLDLITGAAANGLDVTTEVYPYTAASTSLESALFDDDWQSLMNISYEDLQWVATGERLTEETFKQYRLQGGTVIIHMMQESWIQEGLSHPETLVASDGMPYAPLAHPRTAGTFARVLGHYVREKQILSLPEAIRRMTLLPARRLEKISTAGSNKGRIQPGKDADITVFDPLTIKDNATFTDGLAESTGVHTLIIMGTPLIEQGVLIKDRYPGQPVYGKQRIN